MYVCVRVRVSQDGGGGVLVEGGPSFSSHSWWGLVTNFIPR